MKTQMTKKDAFQLAFPNGSLFAIKLDKRQSNVKKVLKFFTANEIEAIQAKRLARFNQRKSGNALNLVQKLKSLNTCAASFGSYSKIIIEGHKNLYLASPAYLHSDYNKTLFAANTDKNRIVANIFNQWLLKH